MCRMHFGRAISPRRASGLLLFCSSLLFAAPLSAGIANPADLLISEYLEGSSNDKAIEIWNGTGSAVDLAAGVYTLEFFLNGGGTASNVLNLTGTVADGDVFVVADVDASAGILAAADLLDGGTFFNGDDAVVLKKNGVVIDAIGQVGFDPGSEWNSNGVGTQNENLRLKGNECCSDSNETDAYDPSARYASVDDAIFDGLGSHVNFQCVGDPILEIYEIQGSLLASPAVGLTVTTEDNIVYAVASNGFLMQTPDARDDADDATSNGIFVFTGGAPTVAVGDQVDVTGNVIEFFSLTEFSGGLGVSIDSSGNPLPTAVTLDAMTPSPNQPQSAYEFERLEGMRVSVAAGVVCSGNQEFGSDPTAEVFMSTGERCFRETGIEFPGLPGLPIWDGNPELFELDPDRLGLANQQLAAGTTFSAEGAIGFDFGDYELWPSSLTILEEATLPQPVRAATASELTIGSINVFRLFDDVDDPSDMNSLGETRDDAVVSAAEYQRRLDKLVLYILEVLRAPDVLAFQEVEKLEVLQDLEAAIEAADMSVEYTAHLVEGNDVGTIDNGYLVRDTVTGVTVTQMGLDETFIFDMVTDLTHDRPPLLLEASFGGLGFAVINNHLRSLGGIDGDDGPRVRQKRLEQSQSLAQMAQDYQTNNLTTPLIVLGDLNAFEFTDGYVDVVGQIIGDVTASDNLLSGPDLVSPNLLNQIFRLPAEERYSFNFNGNSQALDHALASGVADDYVSGFEYGRANADAAEVLIEDDSTPRFSSDHDGFVLFLDTTQVIFADGFETGDVSRWSGSSP